MSEPKRYTGKTENSLLGSPHWEHPEGEWVKYEDYARLKAEVEMHSKPATIGGYNLSQYIRMANSETLEFDNGDIFADMTLPERIKYIVKSHARLKADIKDLREDRIRMCDVTIEDIAVIARLKAEVERLTERNQFLEQVDSYLQSANLYAEEQRSLELEAQVERMTKAGDAMADDLLKEFGRKEMLKDESYQNWLAAKEGKPRA